MIPDCVIGPMSPLDWLQVRAIFIEGMETGLASLEAEPPDWEEWDAAHLPDARLVARLPHGIAGWAALCPASRRHVYRGVAEVSVYVAAARQRQGIGRALLRALIEDSERLGIWTLQAVILAGNEASIELHRSCGFREVGRRERIGQRSGVWRDVILMERRSETVGL